MITAERLRELLDYDPETGAFRWRRGRGKMRAGALAGSLQSAGYSQIYIDGRNYTAHRLAWLYVTGRWPGGEIDHADGDRLNNRFANLRNASRSENNANSRRRYNNRSGYKGVSFFKSAGLFAACIAKDGRRFHLGYFQRAEDAHAAYVAKARELYGEFARAR